MGMDQKFLTPVWSLFVAQVGLGRVSHLWFGSTGFRKFPLDKSLWIKKISAGQVKKYPGQRWVGHLFTAGQKYGQVRAHLYIKSIKRKLVCVLSNPVLYDFFPYFPHWHVQESRISVSDIVVDVFFISSHRFVSDVDLLVLMVKALALYFAHYEDLAFVFWCLGFFVHRSFPISEWDS